MRDFFSWTIPFCVKTALIIVVGAFLLFLAILIGVDGSLNAVMVGADLNDIIEIEKYISPQQFLESTAKVFPLADVFVDMVGFAKTGANVDLISHLDLEICKILLLSVVMWVCEFFRKLACKISEKFCFVLEKIGLLYENDWADKLTSAWCFIFSTYISVAVTRILMLRLNGELPFYAKMLPLVVILALCALPFALGGFYRTRVRAISLITKPVCSVLASVCAILAIAVLQTLMYDSSMLLTKAMIALLFLLTSATCIYVAVKGTISDFMKL